MTPVPTRREEAWERAVPAAFAGPARQTSHGHTTTHGQYRLEPPTQLTQRGGRSALASIREKDHQSGQGRWLLV